MPGMWIVAGPDGAGKATLVSRRLANHLPFVNPDEIAFDLPRVAGQLDQRRAGEIAIERRRALLASGETFAIETTLTGSSALRLMHPAKAMGFRINLAFVGLSNVELSGARVLDRVAKGGHAFPNSDLMRRLPASLLNLGIAAKVADRTSCSTTAAVSGACC